MSDTNNMSTEQILELQKKNCIFCKIISKEIPSQEIYSDEKVFVILDINPANEGHCLILPREHYQILPQIPEDLMGHMFVVAKKISKSLLKSMGVQGTSFFVANGAIAGQKSPHFMVHVIPRKKHDMLFSIPKKSSDEKSLKEIQKKLAQRISLYTGKSPPVKQEQPKPLQVEHKQPETQKSDKEPEEKEKVQTDQGEEKQEQQELPKEENAKEKGEKMDLDKIAGLFK